LIVARVETRRLSAMGQGESTCTAPPRRDPPHLGVLAHVAFVKSKGLQPRFLTSYSRKGWLKPKPGGGFKLKGHQLD
jgi:hypothetical protein